MMTLLILRQNSPGRDIDVYIRSKIDDVMYVEKQKNSIFWATYQYKYLFHHNIDVMYVEKNICDSLLVIILDITGKTKDTTKTKWTWKI